MVVKLHVAALMRFQRSAAPGPETRLQRRFALERNFGVLQSPLPSPQALQRPQVEILLLGQQALW